MSCVAELDVQTLVQPVGRWFLAIGSGDEVTDTEFHRSGADGESIEGLPTSFQILDTREDNLSPWEGVEALFRHESSLDAGVAHEVWCKSQAGPAEVGSPKSSTSVSTLPEGMPIRETTKAITIAAAIP